MAIRVINKNTIICTLYRVAPGGQQNLPSQKTPEKSGEHSAEAP